MKKKKQLCLRMLGGLGNQIFEYAYARYLAESTGRHLVIDVRTGFIKDNYNRKPRIKSFLSSYSEASFFDKFIFLLTKNFPQLSLFIFNSIYLKEKNPRYLESHNFKATNNIRLIYIEGYYQSYIYIENIHELIQNEITLNFPKTNQIYDINKKIEKLNSVSIHVRRIDYEHKLDIQYYINAIKLMNKTIFNPFYFIFSDDILWCRENFNFLNQSFFVIHDNDDEVVDLWLISQCKHHIIANSSFSWWGAWLSKNKTKTIIAPKNPQMGVIDNFYPKDWIQLNN